MLVFIVDRIQVDYDNPTAVELLEKAEITVSTAGTAVAAAAKQSTPCRTGSCGRSNSHALPNHLGAAQQHTRSAVELALRCQANRSTDDKLHSTLMIYRNAVAWVWSTLFDKQG